MSAPTHPYETIADYRHWRRAAGVDDPGALDPVVAPKFTISAQDAVASAGSCFAQHVSRHLKKNGFNAMVTEHAPEFLTRRLQRRFQYGVFTTRSGNLYTARQLRQLVERAYNRFLPRTVAWRRGEMFIDPFRPQVAEFVSESELLADRERHFAAVRQMLEALDVFVFTLGLTEAWVDADGAVFPVAPGVAGGTYNPAEHRLKTLSVEETVADLAGALAALRAVNPKARTILTVSPVPLMATALDRHVLVSTTHSKAILRVAAQTLADSDPSVDYFPSYEIVTAPQTRGAYFGPDAREVTASGVDHVMRVFLRHYGEGMAAEPAHAAQKRRPASIAGGRRRAVEAMVDVICEEELLDR